MHKVKVIRTDEQEVLQIIREHFGKDLESIVADQELGNEEWSVDVSPATEYSYGQVGDWLVGARNSFVCTDLLDVLCAEGKIEAGDYLIDCTW